MNYIFVASRAHSILLFNNNPAPAPDIKQVLVPDKQSVGSALEPGFLADGQFFSRGNMKNWFESSSNYDHHLQKVTMLKGTSVNAIQGLMRKIQEQKALTQVTNLNTVHEFHSGEFVLQIKRTTGLSHYYFTSSAHLSGMSEQHVALRLRRTPRERIR